MGIDTRYQYSGWLRHFRQCLRRHGRVLDVGDVAGNSFAPKESGLDKSIFSRVRFAEFVGFAHRFVGACS